MESGVTSDDSPAKRQFLKDGHVWARYQGESKYLPVTEVRYNANVTIPSVIEQHIKVVDLPRRKSTKLVRELFGIEPLASKDIAIRLIHQGMEYDPSSEDANSAFRRALPYLYAIRLGKKLDEDNRERNLLWQSELRLCTCICAEATLPHGEAQSIELISQGDRLLLDRTLYIIDHFDPRAASLVGFWQCVGNLVAELLGTDVAAEAANVFRCRTPAEMEDVVRGLVEEDADGKLLEARERFRSDIEDEPSDPRPMPQPSEPSHDSKHRMNQPPKRGDDLDSEADDDAIDGKVDFVLINAPKQKPGSRRKLVVTRGAARTCPTRRGPLATEEMTFRVVEEYERLQGRFPVRVSHLLGAEGFGCDLLSLDSASALARTHEERRVNESSILRNIEVKGRSSRSGEIELTFNELRKAESEADRYYLYRVFRDPEDGGRFELAILQDPLHSNAVLQVTRFDLSEGSGATWYEMVEVDEP